MEPVLVVKLRIFQEKLILKKWKDYIASIYEDNSFGKARIELFLSEAKRKEGEAEKTVILDQCISMKPVQESYAVRLRMRDGSSLLISTDDIQRLVYVLSSICFPRKVAIITGSPTPPSNDEKDGEEEFEFDEEYPAIYLLLNNDRGAIAEGNATLTPTSEELKIRRGTRSAYAIPYSHITWIASGENCLGFEASGNGIFEFLCYDPQRVVHHIRQFVKFSCDFTPVSCKTINKYTRTFHMKHCMSHKGQDSTLGSSTASTSSTRQIEDTEDDLHIHKASVNCFRYSPSKPGLKPSIVTLPSSGISLRDLSETTRLMDKKPYRRSYAMIDSIQD
ncbi:hypothetical protein WR25_26242 [Diploscapter pachys]|uniref:Uncharacterized protein n=1 Tax=Diploscapter pachys TaxID=2018661 RepID=A0A2A2JT50_9BILA|nr:hypothetical protein WR25_26242 [Diploscapter pachys]